MISAPFQSLYNRVSAACCYIAVLLGDEKISEGTGFSIRPDGQVVTAAHVVTGRWPIRAADYTDPNARIYVKFAGIPLMEYRVVVCGITVEVSCFKDPVQLDEALLVPKAAASSPIPFISAIEHPPTLGQEVFLAGYSDELELPFDVARLVSPEINGVPEFLQALDKGNKADMTGPLIKRGIVGNVRRMIAENTAEKIKVECDVFYVDNSVHSGASGGPVFDGAGYAVGLITKRATTSVSQRDFPNLIAPSGATVGLGLQPLAFACAKLNSNA